MNKKFLSLIGVGLLSVALAACGAEEKPEPKDEPKQTETAEKPAEEVKPTGNVVEVTVNAKSFDFDVKEIKAKAGDTVKLTLVNADGAHALGIDAFGVDVKGGETKEFVVNKKGTFDFYCSLMCGVGHDKMMGKLIVE